MFNFGLYLLSFAANTLVVLTAPANLLRGYVLTYNVASVIFSLSFFAYFSRFATVIRSRMVIAFFAVALVVCGLTIGWYETCIFAYPGLLIVSDYLVTQSFGIRVVTGFRVLMIVSAIPFLLFPDLFVTNLAIRVALLLALSVIFVAAAKETHFLSVKSPVRYQIGNYLFYNGTLSSLALLISAPEVLRWWYVATQICLVLVLKVLDYSLRRAYALDALTRRLAFGASASVPFVAFVIHPNILGLALAYGGFIGLVFTGRYISR